MIEMQKVRGGKDCTCWVQHCHVSVLETWSSEPWGSSLPGQHSLCGQALLIILLS
jgi:hypothetical protein